jgi:hypothetical protein
VLPASVAVDPGLGPLPPMPPLPPLPMPPEPAVDAAPTEAPKPPAAPLPLVAPGYMMPGMVRPGMPGPARRIAPPVKPLITPQQARLGTIAAALGAGLFLF